MRLFVVRQDTVKSLAKSLRNAFGPAIKHKAMIRLICTALGWRDDALMHSLKMFAEAGVAPTPPVAVPNIFSHELSKALTSGYGTPISRQQVDHVIASSMTFYRPDEPIFGAVARIMVDLGWSVFPQELNRSHPATIDGKIIRWNEEHDLANALPDNPSLIKWVDQCHEMNVGVVMGPASGNIIMLDIDVVDHDLSAKISDLATFHLGMTPFRRVGTFPQMTFIYRQSADNMVQTQHVQFEANPTNEKPGSNSAVSLITNGPALLYGKHPKTGRYFMWLDDSPVDLSPAGCPVVTPKQIEAFFKAVSDLSKSTNKPSSNPDWTLNEDGLVHDGREAYLLSLVTREARKLVATARLSNDTAAEDVLKVAEAVAFEFSETAVKSGGWSDQRILPATLTFFLRVLSENLNLRTRVALQITQSKLLNAR